MKIFLNFIDRPPRNRKKAGGLAIRETLFLAPSRVLTKSLWALSYPSLRITCWTQWIPWFYYFLNYFLNPSLSHRQRHSFEISNILALETILNLRFKELATWRELMSPPMLHSELAIVPEQEANSLEFKANDNIKIPYSLSRQNEMSQRLL